MKIFTHFGAWAEEVMEEIYEREREREVDDKRFKEVYFKINNDAQKRSGEKYK